MRASYLIAILISVVLISGCAAQSSEDKIRQQLVGMELKYTTIAGKIQTFKVAEKDIQNVRKTDDGWVAKVGQGMQWNIYFDRQGNKVREEQLFIT